MTVKPWCNFVEMWLFNWTGCQHKVYTGRWNSGPEVGLFGTFRGKVCPGDEPREAAARIVFEQSGLAAKYAFEMPITPMLLHFGPTAFQDPELRESMAAYKGIRTSSFWGNISNALPIKPFKPHGMKNVQWWLLTDLAVGLQHFKDTVGGASYRYKVIQYLADTVPEL